MPRLLTYAQAINEATKIAMLADDSVICYGLGVDDPKGVFATTLGLQEQFGEQRVFDMPTSENAMTGIGIGAAIYGLKPIMVHQRLDFFLLAMDQLVNNAAKWHFMFAGQHHVPITIRLILGRGWGQGPTHSQNLQAWFAHIPGLKVVMPATAQDAKGLLLASIFDPSPVVFLEHRWLHNLQGEVAKGDYRIAIGQAAVIQQGEDITLVAMSYMTIEALKAYQQLSPLGIHVEVIDLRTIRPIDWPTIITSVQETGRLLVLDTAAKSFSVASEICATLVEQCWQALKTAPKRLALPDSPEPTSFALTKNYYVNAYDICKEVCQLVDKTELIEKLDANTDSMHDVPGDYFKGPF